MKTPLLTGAVVLFVGLINLPAAVLYVDLNCANPTPPYADWSTAATNIQDAVDAASAGDSVLVTNGVYETGGRPAPGEILTNRVLVTNAITLQSVNGPAVTTINGYQVATNLNGDGAVRCAHLADGCKLSGFTLANGATRQMNGCLPPFDQGVGGGVWCQSTNVLVSNCVIISNYCSQYGGGVYSGSVSGCQINYNGVRNLSTGKGGAGVAYSQVSDCTIRSNYTIGVLYYTGAGALYSALDNCTLEGNWGGGGAYGCSLTNCSILNNNNTNSVNGGGVAQSRLDHCTIAGNRASASGGGASECFLDNCVISNNWAGRCGGGVYAGGSQTNALGQNTVVCGNSALWQGGGVYVSSWPSRSMVNWMVTSNSSASNGGGVYATLAMLVDGCTFAGNYSASNGGGFYSDSYQNPSPSVISNSVFSGNLALGDGGGAYKTALVNCSLLGNKAGNSGGVYGVATNCVFTSNVATGNGGGLSSYSPIPVMPNCNFTNNSAANGGGAYGGTFSNCVFFANVATTNGGGAYNAALNNCLLISNQAAFGGGAFVGDRCFYPGTFLTYLGCRIVGNSARRDGGGLNNAPYVSGTNCLLEGNSASNNGGGLVFGTFTKCTVDGNYAGMNGGGACSNWLSLCAVSNNVAGANGGGTFGSTVDTSLLTGNTATHGGGAYGGNLTSCTVSNNVAATNGGGTFGSSVSTSLFAGNTATHGGGAYGGSLLLCRLLNNVAEANGGGIYNAVVNTSLLTGNAAANGGGAYACALNNSTIVGNQATLAGGGAYFPNGGSASSCIIYDNAAPSDPNYAGNTAYHYSLSYCCTTPLPSSGNYNLANAPSFVSPAAGNYRLQTNSPCINAGFGNSPGFDLDGRLRVVGGKTDIGAYEFQGPGVGEFIPWLQQYGLPTSGSSDYADTDRDGLNNWQEWLAGTDPTNSASALKMLTPACIADGTGTVVSWQSVTNRTYFLQRSDALLAPAAFSTIQSNIAGQFSTTSYTDTNAPGAAACFYRVGIQ